MEKIHFLHLWAPPQPQHARLHIRAGAARAARLPGSTGADSPSAGPGSAEPLAQRDNQHPFGSNLDHRLRHDGLQFCTILQNRRVKQLLVPQCSWTELTGATCSVQGNPESLEFSFCRRETRQKYNRAHNYRFKQVGWVRACGENHAI